MSKPIGLQEIKPATKKLTLTSNPSALKKTPPSQPSPLIKTPPSIFILTSRMNSNKPIELSSCLRAKYWSWKEKLLGWRRLWPKV